MGSESLNHVLQTVRAHLGMDVAFISEFVDGKRIFLVVDASGTAPICVGDSNPLEESYCQHVVDGRLPELIPDTSAVPETKAFSATEILPVGAHLSVPLRLRDGSVFGTFCCFSYLPDHSLNKRDLELMRAFADMAADHIETVSDLSESLNAASDQLLSKETQLRGVSRDLAQSVLQLNTLMQSAPLSIIAYDLQERVIFWNPAAEQTFGFTADEVLGLPPPHVPRGAPVLEGGVLADAIRPRFRKDGTELATRLWVSPLRDVDGRVTGEITITKDVTQEQAIEAQLRQAQKMEVVGQLTGGIAHDFNNLLGIILGNAELMAEDLDHPVQRQTAELIVCTAERGARLTHQLLAFARKQDLAPEPLDVNEVVTNLTTLLSRSLGAHIDIRTDLEPDLPWALADHAQLEAALVNLAVNARDAMPQGGRLLLETTFFTADEEELGLSLASGSFIRVAVTDTGTGMPPDVVARVFEPFFTTKEVGKGTGLGLSMVYGFAQQSEGQVQIHSEVGVGTTISIYLPVARDPNVRTPIPGADAIPLGSSETILLVEDELILRHFLATTLEKLNYRVVACADGPCAIAELGKGLVPDLLLTDVILPGNMNGRELAEAIKQCRPEVRVVLMSGYQPEAAVLDSRAQILRKPFRKAELAQMLHAALYPRRTQAHV